MAQDESKTSRMTTRRATGSRRLSLGLLGMCVFAFLIERRVDNHGLDLSTVPLLNARYAAARASRIELNGKVVFLGDSQVKSGMTHANSSRVPAAQQSTSRSPVHRPPPLIFSCDASSIAVRDPRRSCSGT